MSYYLDTMGQCQCCTKTKMTSAAEDKENLSDATGNEGTQAGCGRPSGSDSAVDSGHSSGDEGSCGVNGGKVANNNVSDAHARNSHSSESSGKYSLRDSIGSSGDFDRSNFHPGRIDESTIDMPVFAEENDELSETLGSMHSPGMDRGEILQAMRDHNHTRKISRGSRGSSSSERGSFSSVSSVTAILKARLGRSSSLVSQQDQPEAETQSTSSVTMNDSNNRKPQRTVSLRLPRSHRKPHDSDTNLPTIYVDDSPQHPDGRRPTRKSSLRRALSLLSMNSLVKHEAAAAAPSQQKPQKPVQKILRQPRRRHNTVRGLSGLAIDGSNQGMRNPSLHRSHTVYYPTATSLRYSTNSRRTHSITS